MDVDAERCHTWASSSNSGYRKMGEQYVYCSIYQADQLQAMPSISLTKAPSTYTNTYASLSAW